MKRRLIEYDLPLADISEASAEKSLHERLHIVCRRLPTDFEPYGKRVRTAADCSWGRRHFLELPEPLGSTGAFASTPAARARVC